MEKEKGRILLVTTQKGDTPMEANARILPQSQILKEWHLEVKENFWEADAKPHIRLLLKEFMERTMIQELSEILSRERYESTQEDGVYRNGFYERGLVTQFGLIENLQVPRIREGRIFKTSVFKRYRRFQDIVEDMIRDVFLAGISTRRVGEAISKLLDTDVSSGTVSNITKKLDEKVRAFHKAPILDEYQYLILDGIVLKILYGARYHKRRVLAVYGITVFGERKLLAFKQAKGESQSAWESLLWNLYERGLKGECLKLIVMDGSAGLRVAAELVYPEAKIQRCWVHKLRNVSNYCRKKYEKDLIAGARKIYLVENKIQAITRFKAWKKIWEKICPEAVRCIEKDLEELLNFLDCPNTHRIRIRTTNAIERSFREIRRRTKVFTCFSNSASSDRIIYAIFTHLNNSWKDRPLKQFTQFD